MHGSICPFSVRRCCTPVLLLAGLLLAGLLLAGLFATAAWSAEQQGSSVAMPQTGTSRHQELRNYVRRFQVTPTTLDFGPIQGDQPRNGQADPLAIERALTTIPYRSLNPENPGREFVGRPLLPRELTRPTIRDQLPDRVRTGQVNPLVYDRVFTTQGRWDFSREPDPRTLQFTLEPAESEASSMIQSFNNPPARPPRPTYSLFNRDPDRYARTEPQPRRTVETSPGLTFSRERVPQDRRAPVRYIQPSRPTPAPTLPDRPFRRPPRTAFP